MQLVSKSMRFTFLRNPPVAFTFVVSLLLSWVALVTHPILNKDGMLYVEAAKTFMNEGFGAATAVFSWPFLSILIGALSALTGISPEICGHVLNALFMAGCCALWVDIVSKREKDRSIIWLSALVVLAIPGLNGHRDELLREYGCWFFTLWALRTALDWPSRPSWSRAFCLQGLFLFAALFRPEAIAYYLCVMLWEYHCDSPLPHTARWLRLLFLPVLFLSGLLAAYFSGNIPLNSRFAGEISRFNLVSDFNQLAQKVGEAFNESARYTDKTAGPILFFGSLALIPWGLFPQYGLLLIPLVLFFFLPERRAVVARYRIFVWAIGIHVLILALFVLKQQFLASRYLVPILIFSVPFVTHGLGGLLKKYPSGKKYIFALCILLAICNVVLPLNESKGYFVAAGHWLAARYTEGSRVYVESARAAYYAGWHYQRYVVPKDRQALSKAVATGQYDLLILETSAKEENIADWLKANDLVEIKRFSGRPGDAVVIARPLSLPAFQKSQ